MKLRSHFAVLVAVTLLPVLLLVGTVVYLVHHERRTSVERGLRESASALTEAIERELESSITALKSLAVAPSLDGPDLPVFYEQARRTREVNRRWLTVYLVEPSGHQLMTLLRPLGTALPNVAGFDFVQAVRDTGQPYVTNLDFGLISKQHIIHVNVPVIRDGRIRYILGVSMKTDAFAELLASHVTSPGAIGAVRDRRDVLMARSHEHQRYLGRPASDEVKAKLRPARENGESVFEVGTRDGVPMLVAARHVPTADFVALAAVPLAAIAHESKWFWALLSIGGIGVVVTALGVSAILARRIARPITALTTTAAELASGEPISPPSRSSVDEVVAVREAMVRGAEALRERAAEREQRIAAERRTEVMERMNREKDEFLAMLGHELRNPLGAIASANAVLGRVGNVEPTAGRARAIIDRQVRHLVDILDDLLDVSRLTMGKIVLTRRPVDLAEIVRGSLESFETHGRTSAHKVSFDGMPVWVDGDETRLEQIAGNLITNALKYTPAGGGVDVSVARERDEAVLRVRDTGIGIPAERLPQVFDLFFQGERTLDRSHGGLGIGLTLVKRLTELHGGSVAAQSAGANRGSTFTVRFPAIAPAATNWEPLASDGGETRHRIVIIEDNVDLRDMLKGALALAGHDVWDAGDGERGIELVRAHQPDAVVVDIGLPGLDGYEVARRLRELPGGGALCLVALSGYGQAEDRRRSGDAGFDTHLVKPIDPARLGAVICSHRRAISG